MWSVVALEPPGNMQNRPRMHNPKNVQKSEKKMNLKLQILAQSWDFDASGASEI